MAQYETVSIGNLEDYLEITTPFTQIDWHNYVVEDSNWIDRTMRYVPYPTTSRLKEDKEKSIYRIE